MRGKFRRPERWWKAERPSKQVIEMIIREMEHAECIALMSNKALARLACSNDGMSYVVPISIRYVDGCILSFSRPGKKIEWMRRNDRVCVEIDEIWDKRQWKCVVAEGRFHELTEMIERERAWSLLQKNFDWWEPGGFKTTSQTVHESLDPVYFKIEITSMSGHRAFDE